jgi:predicted phage baseplate assembly protein
VTSEDDEGRTLVRFGDGVSGARVPSGRDNVRARYRWGQGAAGNLEPGSIRQLVDSLPGLQAVENPERASGGADRETPDEIRFNAPGHIRTLGRAVSVDDYRALALSFPGIRRARAVWAKRDEEGKLLARPEVQLTVDTGEETLSQEVASRLRRFLDVARDRNVHLRVLSPRSVDVVLEATVEVLDDHGRKATLRAAQDAMRQFFAALGFGDAVFLSAVYAAQQRVEGVREAVVKSLHGPLQLQTGFPIIGALLGGPRLDLLGRRIPHRLPEPLRLPSVEDPVPVPSTGLARLSQLSIQLDRGGLED